MDHYLETVKLRYKRGSWDFNMFIQRTKKRLLRFLADESGPTAVEYAVIIALIIVVCISAVTSMSTATRASLDASSNAIQSVL